MEKTSINRDLPGKVLKYSSFTRMNEHYNIIFTGLVEGKKSTRIKGDQPDISVVNAVKSSPQPILVDVVCEPNTAIGSSMLDDNRPIDRMCQWSNFPIIRSRGHSEGLSSLCDDTVGNTMGPHVWSHITGWSHPHPHPRTRLHAAYARFRAVISTQSVRMEIVLQMLKYLYTSTGAGLELLCSHHPSLDCPRQRLIQWTRSQQMPCLWHEVAAHSWADLELPSSHRRALARPRQWLIHRTRSQQVPWLWPEVAAYSSADLEVSSSHYSTQEGPR